MAYQDRFEAELRRMLAEKRAEHLESLAAGLDQNHYWRLVGVVQTLRDLEEVLDEVVKKIEER